MKPKLKFQYLGFINATEKKFLKKVIDITN